MASTAYSNLPDPATTQVIEPLQPQGRARVLDLWAYRHLLRYFAARAMDRISAFTILGRSWLVLRPLADTGGRALVFGAVLNAPSLGTPYFLFFLVGMWCWRLFERSLFWATRGMEINRKLLRKMYFPRLLLPVASTAPAMVEFLTYTAMVVLTLIFFAITDGQSYIAFEPRLLLVPLALAIALGLALAVGLFTSVLGAYGRDTRYSLVYVLDFMMFMTPVIYPLEAIPESLRPIALLNPMTSVVEALRYASIGAGELYVVPLTLTGVLVVVLLALGLRFFRRFEAQSIDAV